MQTYNEARNEIVKFLNKSGISPFDLARISKELCSCRTCKHFVQHYSKDGRPVDFGHCISANVAHSRRPNQQSCCNWTLDDEVDL